MTPDEFGAKIKAKYPDYAGMDNLELSRRIVDKHPEYASQVDFKDAVSDSPRQSADLGEALLTNLPTTGFKQDLVRGLPTAGGGMAGAAAGALMGTPLGPVGMAVGGIAGGFLGGAAGESARQGVSQVTAAAFPEARYPIQRPGQVLRDVAIQGATNAAGEAVGLGLGAAARYAASKLAKPAIKVGSQAVRAMTGVPEDAATKVLRDPSILSRAMPIDEAGELYREGVGDAAEGAMEAGRSIFGKTYPGPEAAVNTFDELRGSLGAAHPNELLGMRQTMMDTLSDTPKTSPKLRKMLSERIDVLDGMLESRLPDWGGAKQAWREAKVGEEFGSWLPLNKNLSPNVLRTTAAVAAAVKGASEGSPWGALALPLVSPKAWGLAIRGTAATASAITSVGKPIYRVGAPALAGATGSALQQAYMAQPR